MRPLPQRPTGGRLANGGRRNHAVPAIRGRCFASRGLSRPQAVAAEDQSRVRVVKDF